MTIDYNDIVIAKVPENNPDLSYLEQKDMERLAAYERGDFGYVGVYARFESHNYKTGVTVTFRSAGLWDIESDSETDYFQEVFNEERNSLIANLEAQGIKVTNKPVTVLKGK